ncbi:MAG: cupin 2 conserved barrel domain protein [Burkholderiales bacterium RIFCSPLOWO2_12_FULL_61_40]|nr:MAG: cupin 2 conserved barrel domain protein [Burkholderiales bacterium RIFCSPLOWO2_12_FULL_61_40]
MAIAHTLSGQPTDVSPLGTALAAARTVALFKTDELEVIRLVLHAGKSMPPHQVAGAITLQCIEGQIDVTCEDGSHRLGAGQLLYLPGGVQHGVVAVEDASALLTIVLRK